MKIRMIALFAVAAVAMAALAGSASALPAANSGVGVFTGTATVAPGLLLPSATTPVSGTWTLATTVTGVPVSGALNAGGGLSPVANIGAACGISNGHSGTGTFAGAYNLTDLGWASSAGGTLPVTGHYQKIGGLATDSGPVVALVQAQGGSQCTTGATSFTVVGVSALL